MIADTRIGIGIVHCQSAPGSTDIGYTPVFKSDNGKWSSIIDDTGTVFRHVKIEYDTILRMIHFSKDGQGWYMCSMKPVPGRDEEYRASWVYFPASLNLSQKDIKTIIEIAESQIKEKEFDSNKLQEVIQSYNQLNEEPPLYNVPPSQSGFAFRDTSGDFNLYDLYGCMYQKEFTKYEWVLLMDKSSLSFKGNSVKDISNEKIIDSCVIKPIPNEFGFTPYRNGTEFRSPVRIMDGEQLTVEFKKSGYLPIKKSVKTQADFSIKACECKKYFKKSQFVAYDSNTNKQISSAIIKPINAKESKDHLSWIFAEQELENAEFEVKADGYTADSFVFDLRNMSLNDEKNIPLDPEAHEYLFVLPLDKTIVKDADSAEVIIRSQFVIRESPIKGYRCAGMPREDQTNILTAVQQNTTPARPYTGSSYGYNGERGRRMGIFDEDYFGSQNPTPFSNEDKDQENLKSKSIWKYVKYAVCCIGVVVIVSFVGKNAYDYFFNNNVVRGTITEPFRMDDDESDSQWNIAYGYLKEHTNQINKNDMECFDDLKGLYDIVNEYRFKDYIEYIDKHPHHEDILTIDEWKRLYEKSKEICSNKKGVYNRKGAEQSITFESFFKKDFSSMADTEIDNVPEQNGSQKNANNGQVGSSSIANNGMDKKGQQGDHKGNQTGGRQGGAPSGTQEGGNNQGTIQNNQDNNR